MANTREVELTWSGGLRFDGGRVGGPSVTLDGDGTAGPSPVETLLLAAAGCTAADVVLILEKMRQPLVGLDVRAVGTRREEDPKRVTALRLVYRVRGTGLDMTKVRRAVELSLETYCSVLHSLAPDITIGWDLELA